MVNLTDLPDDIIRHCVVPFLNVRDQRSLLDTNRDWYKYKKSSWYITIRRSDILNNLVSNPLVNNLVIKNNSNNNVMNEIGKITGNIYNGDIETFLDDGVVHPPDNPFTISDMPCNNPDIPDIM